MEHTTKPVEPIFEATPTPSYPAPAPTWGHPAQTVAPALLAPNPALSAPPDALSLLAALRRRWVPALVLAVIAAGTCAPVAYFCVPQSKYTAHASLRVAAVPRRIMFQPQDNGTDPGTVVALLKDQFVISHALSSPRVAGLPTFKKLAQQDADIEDWVTKNLAVGFRDRSEVLEVALSGDEPDDLAAIVNAVVDSYMTLVVKEENDARLVRLEKLKELYERYQRDLKVKRTSFKEVASSVGSHDERSLALAQQFKSTQLTLAQSEHARTQAELWKAQAELATLENMKEETAPAPVEPGGAPSDAELAATVEQHPDVAALKDQLARLDRKYEAAARLTRDKGDPALMLVARQKQAVVKDLAALRKQIRAAVTERATPAVAGGTTSSPSGRARDIMRLRAQIEVLDGYRKALADVMERTQREMQEASRNGVDLESERQGIGIATDFAQKVGAEVEAVTVELNAPDRVRVLSPAKAPKLKDDSKRVKMSAMTGLGSFALCLLGVSLWEFRARRIDSHEQVVHALGLKLMGTLPDLSRSARALPAPEGAAAARGHRHDPLVEAVNATRTMVLHASHIEGVRVVMITSAVKGEGKSSLSSHLATSLARTGRRVLLIDGDLRSPSVHRLFRKPQGVGLCELLRREAMVPEVLQSSGVPNLELITAGQYDASAVHALARDVLRDLFDRLKQEFDFVIVDSAPILPLADSLLLAQSVDGVIFSVLRLHSRLPMVHSARERLAVLGVKLLGAVVSGVRGEMYQTTYYDTKAQADA